MTLVILILPADFGGVVFLILCGGALALGLRSRLSDGTIASVYLGRKIQALVSTILQKIQPYLQRNPVESDHEPSMEIAGSIKSQPLPALQITNSATAVDAAVGNQPERVAYVVPPTFSSADISAYLASINWERLIYLLGILSLLLVAVTTSVSLVQAHEIGQPILLQGMIVLGLCTAGVAILAAIIMNFRATRYSPESIQMTKSGHGVDPTRSFASRYGPRLVGIAFALYFSWAASLLAGVELSPLVVLCWWVSIPIWLLVLYDSPGKLLERLLSRIFGLLQQGIRFRLTWTIVCLFLIVLLGAWLRFSNLTRYPPDPTTDHYDEEVGIQYVVDGHSPVFLPLGGREALHYYVGAALQKITGWPVNLSLLKLTSGIEGMLFVLMAFWMGKTLLEDESPPLGNLVGLIMAFFVATGFWTVLLSRDGTRVNTSFIPTMLTFTFLVRSLRHNRRGDYLATGFFLGVGLYTYASVRALPILVVAGFVIVLITRPHARQHLRSYITNMAALIVMAFAVYVPMGSYALQEPSNYWVRVSDTVLGPADVRAADNAPTTIGPYLESKVGPFLNNMVGSALLFNWEGDARQFYGSLGGDPILDPFTSSLLVLGLGLVVVRIIQRRDPGDWLLPIAFVIGLVPSALVVGRAEGPSMFRIIDTAPIVYFVAALTLGLIVFAVREYVVWIGLRRVIYAGIALLLVLGFSSNYNQYFVKAYALERGVLPTQQTAALVENFNQLNGTNTNTFLLYIGGFMSTDSISREAGDPNAISGFGSPFDLKAFEAAIVHNAGTPREFRPDRMFMFVAAGADDPGINASNDALKAAFPNLTMLDVPTEHIDDHFHVFIIPAVGCAWVIENTGITPKVCGPQSPAS